MTERITINMCPNCGANVKVDDIGACVRCGYGCRAIEFVPASELDELKQALEGVLPHPLQFYLARANTDGGGG